jgi:hypothetical protein
MRNVDEQIKISDDAICKLIDKFEPDERGFLALNILNGIRTFVEAVSVKVAGETDYSNDIFKAKAKNYVASRADLRFLSQFHKSLQKSKSHYATDEETSGQKWGQPPFFSLPTPLNTCSIPYFFTTFDTQPSLPYGILLSSERSRASSSGTVRGLFNSFR